MEIRAGAIIMDEPTAAKCLDLIDEAIGEVGWELGYCRVGEVR